MIAICVLEGTYWLAVAVLLLGFMSLFLIHCRFYSNVRNIQYANLLLKQDESAFENLKLVPPFVSFHCMMSLHLTNFRFLWRGKQMKVSVHWLWVVLFVLLQGKLHSSKAFRVQYGIWSARSFSGAPPGGFNPRTTQCSSNFLETPR